MWVVGALTTISALAPPLRNRVGVVTEIVPPVFPIAATTGSAAIGVILMVLSRMLRRGKFRAWLIAVILVSVGAVLHLLRELDVEDAVISLALLGLLFAGRRNFTARPDPRSLRYFAVSAVISPLMAIAIGWVWLSIDRDEQAVSTTATDRLVHVVVGLLGFDGPLTFTNSRAQQHVSVALVVLAAAVLVQLLTALMMPAGGPRPQTPEETAAIRTLLERWGGADSLSYFATRSDRSVIFRGSAALTYRVVGTVSLAAGDPIGDAGAWPELIEQWLDEARSFGWVPAVLGASERGARAYDKAGLEVFELGDEAVVDVERFTLKGREMRGVRHAVTRCERAGLRVECRRVSTLTASERDEIVQLANDWRDGETERGFSMALGRYVDPVDPEALVVLCRDADGALHGILNFVPWGPDGLSLDLMRRNRDSVTGIIEFMVAELCAAGPSLGVTRFSLNFAVFRSVFARGEQLGAGPVLQFWHAVLLWLSRFWQIESLYRANAKYRPEWLPRYLCYARAGDLPRVATAALRAEALLVAPSWLPSKFRTR